MDSFWSKLDFGGACGLVEVNLDGFEKFRPDGLSLVHNRY